MTNLVVVFPKAEEAKAVKGLLMRSGFHVTTICTTGTQALAQMDDLGSGIVICGYKFADMMFFELHDSLPAGFDMLLIASANQLRECNAGDIVCLSMPLKVQNLIGTVQTMVENAELRKRRLRQKPKERNPEEMEQINEAKKLLMSRKNMTEQEAHRYLQKTSMDSGTGMVEAAQMVLTMM